MQPGLSRAVPLGILGFLIGTLILMLIRTLQSLQPVLDAQLAIVAGSLFCAAFFVWGMGAFDPKMSQHAHEPSEGEEEHALAHAEEHAEEEKPVQILGGYVWLLSTLLIVMMLVIAIFALTPDGLTLQTVGSASGNVAEVGQAELRLDPQFFFGLIPVDPNQPLMVSKLAVLAGFIIFMFVSLAVAAGGIGLVMNIISRGATEAKVTSRTSIGYGPLGTQAPADPQVITILVFAAVVTIVYLLASGLSPKLQTVAVALAALTLAEIAFYFLRGGRENIRPVAVFWISFSIITFVLYPLFYYILIGLILPTAPFLGMISLVNALVFALIIMRPKGLMRLIGQVAAAVARFLRRIPGALQ
jgi:hypothetical protein